MSSPLNPKEYKVKLPKDIIKSMNEQYHFSNNDNQIKKTKISPEKFLKTTYKESLIKCKSDNDYRKSEGKKSLPCDSFRDYRKSALSDYKIIGIKQVLTGRKESKYGIPVPFLEFDNCNRPIGHEGRHTATALKSLGIRFIPVTIVKRNFQYNWEKKC